MSQETEIDPNYLAVLQIEATNRATHATRGLLKVVLFEGVGVLVGSLFFAFAIINGSDGALGLGALVVVAGTIAAVVAGFDELGNSKVMSMSVSGVKFPAAKTAPPEGLSGGQLRK